MAVAKPRDTLSVCLCYMDVSDCARLRPFRLSGSFGSVCAKRLGNPGDERRPEHVYCSYSAAESKSTVKMNGRSERQKKKTPPRSQTPQCKRKRRVASVSGIKLNVYASPLQRL